MAPATRNRVRNQPAKAKRSGEKQLEAEAANNNHKKQRREDETTEEQSTSLFSSATKGTTTKGIGEIKKEMRKKADEVAKQMDKELRKDRLDKDMSTVEDYDLAPILSTEDSQTIFETAIRCLTSFQALAKEYEALNSSDNKVQKPETLHWDQDRNDLEALNRGAMGAAFRILNGIVMPHAIVEVGDKAGGGESDVEALASELLAEAKAKPGDATWGTIAQGYLRALSGVAELLVEEKQSQSQSSKSNKS